MKRSDLKCKKMSIKNTMKVKIINKALLIEKALLMKNIKKCCNRSTMILPGKSSMKLIKTMTLNRS